MSIPDQPPDTYRPPVIQFGRRTTCGSKRLREQARSSMPNGPRASQRSERPLRRGRRATRPPTSSHLRGAVGWNWTSQLADGVRRDIATKEDLGELLSQSGIGPDTTIVLYGDNNNWFAAWAYWQLKLFGLRDVRILNGGRKYWLDNGLPVTTDVPSYQPTGIQLGDPDFTFRAFRDDVLPRVGDSTLALVDVRSPAEFNGEVIAPPGMSETAQRAGTSPAQRRSRGRRPPARTAPSRAARSSPRSTRARASRPTRTSSPTAGSASGRATRGSSSTSCSVTSASGTMTAAGPSTAAWSACRSKPGGAAGRGGRRVLRGRAHGIWPATALGRSGPSCPGAGHAGARAPYGRRGRSSSRQRRAH